MVRNRPGGYPICGSPRRGDHNQVCTLGAGYGTDHLGYGPCKWHAGNTPQVRDKVMRDHFWQLHEDEMTQDTLHSKIPRIDPRTALLEEVQRTASIVAWVGDRVRALPEEGLSQVDNRGNETPAFLLRLYEMERMHLVRAAKAACDAGVAERQVELAEEQGRMLAGVIRALLSDPRLELTSGQRHAALGVARELITALPVGSSAGEPLTVDVDAGAAN